MPEGTDACIVQRIETDTKLREQVYSLVRYGSFERGDFVPGLSDLDYFVVVEDDEDVVAPLEDVIEDCTDGVDYREIDLAWEYRRNLGDPDAGVRYKFLTVYQADFRRHHTVVYGADVVSELPERDFDEMLPARLDRIERLVEERDEERTRRFLAGEVARLRALVEGADSLRKEDVVATLEANDCDARRVYAAYLGETDTDLDPAYCRRFVDEQVDAMRSALE